MSNIRLRVATLIEQNDKVLLIEHQKNGKRYWLLPGGGVEFGESLAEGAKRELLEETHLTVAPGDLLFVSETIAPDNSRHVVHLVLEAKIIAGTPLVGDEDRLVQTKFFPVDELANLTMHPPIVAAIAEYVKGKHKQSRPIYLGPLWCD